jgi:hypothetical protein
MSDATFLDTLKGVALIATFIGFLSIFAMWVAMGQCVACIGRADQGKHYSARIGPSHCLSHSWSWWWTEGCKLT